MFRFLVLLALLSASLVAPAFAGQNAGAVAVLSWSPTARSVDLCPASASATFYVLFGRITSFKGAEVHLAWRPASTTGCFEFVSSRFPLNTDGSCTYLNKGTILPIEIQNDQNGYAIAWASNECLTGCSHGAALAVQLAFDGCSSAAGCIVMTFAELLDCNNEIDVATLTGRVVTVCGGGVCKRSSPMEIQSGSGSDSWGSIKALYR